MTRKWFDIAKADFLVGTAKLRRRRKIILPAVLLLIVAYAVYLVPIIIDGLVGLFGSALQGFLLASLPGFMRSMMLLVWMLVFVFPISTSLQEIKVSQWEVLLSHRVSTRDILVGMFLSKIPVYGLVTMIFAPLLVVPFAQVYKVSLTGQLVMYLEIFFVFIGVLWLSTLVSTAIQAKLGESPRGNDLGKAITFAFAFLFLLPMYGIIYAAGQLSELMGMNVLLLFPFTWGADLATWTVISFSGIGISSSVLALFGSILGLTAVYDVLLLCAFTLGIVGLGIFACDRVFRITGGARTEKVVTIGRDGRFLRGIRRIAPGSFGIRLVTALKDFTRKVQNTSSMLYGIVLSIIVPVMAKNNFPPNMDPLIRFSIASFMITMVMAMMSGMTFGGIGFMDSQDQLWIIKSAPNGAGKFIKARVAEGFLLALVFSVVTPVVATIVFGLGLVELLGLFLATYFSVCASMLIGTGVAANNPNYDDTKSRAFGINRMVTVVLIISTYVATIIAMVTSSFNFELYLVPVILVVPLFIEGVIVVYIGAKRMSRRL